MELERIMREFAAQAGACGIEPDADGTYRLEADGAPMAIFASPDGGINVLAEVGDLPTEGCERFCRMLLEAMFGLRETKGASFQVDSTTGKVILRQRRPSAKTDLAAFTDWLSAFSDVLAEWRCRIADFRPDTGQADEAAFDGEAFGLGSESFLRA